MMRLTLRSSKDARFLARIIDAGNSHPFVLDMGDRRIIDDVQQRLHKGFTMWRFGTLVATTPQDPNLLNLLAEFYCGEGLLVAFEEPTWAGRDATLDERIPVPAADRELFGSTPDTLRTVVPDRDDATEYTRGPDPTSDERTQERSAESTESIEIDEMTDVGAFLEDSTDPAMAVPTPTALRTRGLRATFVPKLAGDPLEDAATEHGDAIEDAGTEIAIKRPKS